MEMNSRHINRKSFVRVLALAICVVFVLVMQVRSADLPGATQPTAAAGPAILSSDDSGPVPVPEAGEKALQFYQSGNVLWCLRVLWELLVPALVLFTGSSARIRNRAARLGGKWLFVVVIYIVTFTVLKYLLEFPLNFYQGFVRQHTYGLSNQTFGRWLGHSLKELGVETAVGAGFLWIPYLLLRKSPRRWWFYIWIATTAATVFSVFVTPIWIDPLFNRFGPVKDKAIEADILALAERAGIEGARVFEVDKSADTKAVNAYVTGFMATKRIVLWDTLIARLDRRELLTVMGHELGHYVLGHVRQGIMLSAFLTFFGLYALYRVNGFLIERFKERFGFDRVSDIASWPLILLLLGVGQLALDPFVLAFSRHVERQADLFALEITRDNRAAAKAEVKLQTANLGVPRPGWFYTLWRASHPSTGERIDLANSYRPWATGQALKYERLFKSSTMDRLDLGK